MRMRRGRKKAERLTVVWGALSLTHSLTHSVCAVFCGRLTGGQYKVDEWQKKHVRRYVLIFFLRTSKVFSATSTILEVIIDYVYMYCTISVVRALLMK
jgi:hypothetical protein